jgi:very-short-patch-repair endonuclease
MTQRRDPALAARLYATPSPLEETLALHLRAAGVPDPKREYKFHATRKWLFDFCWPDRRLAVEVEGGIYSGGRHVRGDGFQKDVEKYNTAALDGWTLLRFTSAMIKSGEALAQIEAALNEIPQTKTLRHHI